MASTTEIKEELQQTSSDGVYTSFLRYKTYVLKVSLHCQGCAKRVAKIFRDIDGVCFTEVDFVHQTVTVNCNIVEVETLLAVLKKKTLKRFEVLKPEPKSKPKDESVRKPKSKEEQSKENQGGVGDKQKGKQPMKAEVVEVREPGSSREKKFEVGGCSYSMKMEEVIGKMEGVIIGKPHEGGSCGGKGGSKAAETGNLPRQSPPVVVAEKQSGGGEKTGGADGSSGVGGSGNRKEKGKEQQNSNDNVNIAAGKLCGNAPSTGSPPAQPMPPPQRDGVHYHAVLPSTSYADEPLFCETPRYRYRMSLGTEQAVQSDNLDTLLPSLPVQPQPYPPSHPYSVSISADTLAYFSDENPKACSVM